MAEDGCFGFKGMKFAIYWCQTNDPIPIKQCPFAKQVCQKGIFPAFVQSLLNLITVSFKLHLPVQCRGFELMQEGRFSDSFKVIIE